MVQHLRALATLAEDIGLVLSTLRVTHNPMELQFQGPDTFKGTSHPHDAHSYM